MVGALGHDQFGMATTHRIVVQLDVSMSTNDVSATSQNSSF